jgi:hypothetical protein
MSTLSYRFVEHFYSQFEYKSIRQSIFVSLSFLQEERQAYEIEVHTAKRLNQMADFHDIRNRRYAKKGHPT